MWQPKGRSNSSKKRVGQPGLGLVLVWWGQYVVVQGDGKMGSDLGIVDMDTPYSQLASLLVLDLCMETLCNLLSVLLLRTGSQGLKVSSTDKSIP